MATPFTAVAFTPPAANDPASIVRAILQLQMALGGTGTLPQNNLNLLQTKVPPNIALFKASSAAGGTTGPVGSAVTIVMGGYFF